MTPDTNEFILRLLIHVLPKLAHAAVAAGGKRQTLGDCV